MSCRITSRLFWVHWFLVKFRPSYRMFITKNLDVIDLILSTLIVRSILSLTSLKTWTFFLFSFLHISCSSQAVYKTKGFVAIFPVFAHLALSHYHGRIITLFSLSAERPASLFACACHVYAIPAWGGPRSHSKFVHLLTWTTTRPFQFFDTLLHSGTLQEEGRWSVLFFSRFSNFCVLIDRHKTALDSCALHVVGP